MTKKWHFYLKYAKDSQYQPDSCDGNCLYAEECPHEKNMLLTIKEKEQIIKLNKEENYDTLNDVYQYVCECLEYSVNLTGNEMVIIPTQTAIEKTEAYCNFIRDHPKQNFIVVVSTN